MGLRAAGKGGRGAGSTPGFCGPATCSPLILKSLKATQTGHATGKAGGGHNSPPLPWKVNERAPSSAPDGGGRGAGGPGDSRPETALLLWSGDQRSARSVSASSPVPSHRGLRRCGRAYPSGCPGGGSLTRNPLHHGEVVGPPRLVNRWRPAGLELCRRVSRRPAFCVSPRQTKADGFPQACSALGPRTCPTLPVAF